MMKIENLVYINDLGFKVTNTLKLADLYDAKHGNVRRSVRRYKGKDESFGYREAIVDGEHVYELDLDNMNLLQTSFAHYPKYDWDTTFETGVLEIPEEEEKPVEEEKKDKKESPGMESVVTLMTKNLVCLSNIVYNCCKYIDALNDEINKQKETLNAVVDKLEELNGEVTDVKEQVLQFVPKTQREYAMRLVEQLAHDTGETVANTYSKVYSEMVKNGFRFPQTMSLEPKINQVEKMGAMGRMIETIKSLFK